ncbi:selenocysteine-specific translation elongation factor [Alicyclobacillus sp. SO9]|uniref:selenocysteine-specific translation elongation factor n=1 Tax=Alicyclobacillus sp. SO9 TaxID=2665646 RepID=UPI0018E75524|nr:selenocysteine-specific translation elongation factor [Alicyclobacillus sp. SO9]QQE79465.1 selenocysteine-specific translation elongation factor [Alicyclobacillus sp. SO9]
MTERHVVIGTAGHIDHGKTMLVQALTGKNTDRLQEEQNRGISIDIDFAPLRFSDATVAGIVDVPGHERFVRNMVAGAAGIDGALVVVDVNEGLMPQTYEHLAILQLLGVTQGVVALTKVDLADSDLTQIAVDVIQESLADTPFFESPIVPVSAKTGQGLEALKEALYQLVQSCETRDASGAFRLPIDKVFSVPGFGTVVSGTIWRGQINTGDSVELLPGGKEARVRGIQVHGEKVQAAKAGQRAALNLTGVDKHELRRGFTASAFGTLHETQLIDAKVHVLDGREKAVEHRERVHFHLGTSEAIGTLLLLEDDVLTAGSEAYVQIQLDRPVVCDTLDFFVLRSYSPVTTIGGGRVIDVAPTRLHRRKRSNVLEMLSERDSDSPQQRLLAILGRKACIPVAEIAAALSLTVAEAADLLQRAQAEQTVVELPSGWMKTAHVEETLRDMEQALWELHQKQRFLNWVQRTRLLAAAGNGLPRGNRTSAHSGAESEFSQRDLLWLLQEGSREQRWIVKETRVKATDWKVTLGDEESFILSKLQHMLSSAGLQPVSVAELKAVVPKRDRIAEALLRHLEEAGTALELTEGLWLHKAALDAAVDSLRELYAAQGPFTVAMARDALASNRKITVMLLEYLDERKVTHRKEDVRTITL